MKLICPDYQPDCDIVAPQCTHRKPHNDRLFGCTQATCLKYDEPFPVGNCVKYVSPAKKRAEKVKQDLSGLFEL
jgi:hypothetical protein